MGELLNFNPNRPLEFEPNRPLEFNPGRALEFNPARELDFQPNRDLGFGRRGVVFRGYVCPICGALVTEDARKCDECGAVFEGGDRASAPVRPPEARGRKPAVAPSPAAPSKATTTRAPGPANFCAYCGAKLRPADEFCWNCGSRSVGGGEVTKLPSRKQAQAIRDLREMMGR